jgi:thiamine biosynthesis lipoprotein
MESRIALPVDISSAALRRCDPARIVMTLGGQALGTSWRVRFATRKEAVPFPLRDLIEKRLALIVAEMSQWEPSSLLSRFNRAAPGTWLPLPPDFATVLTAALDIARSSDGAFDPTHGRLASLLGFGAEIMTAPPTSLELDEARSAAGWRRLMFDPENRRLSQPGGLWLDFSGIAKGYAVDAVAELLRREGIEDALVEIGGELVGRGLKPDGDPWWVDLEDPPGAALPPVRLGLHGLAVATSGDYVRGAHTIDPSTGRPLTPGIVSVSVIHERAMLADAWATALTVLGPEQGISIAVSEDLAVRIVTRESDAFVETLSPKLLRMIEL